MFLKIKSTGLLTPQGTHPLSDERVQPSGVDVIVLEGAGLKQRDQVLHCRTEVSADAQLFQGYY